MLGYLFHLLGSFVWVVWCCILDYVVYIFVDYVARTRLKLAKNDSERNTVWRYMCLIATVLSIFILWYHHLPGLLWTLIALTLLLTFRERLVDKYYLAKHYWLRLMRFAHITWERLKSIRLKLPFFNKQAKEASAVRFVENRNLCSKPVTRINQEQFILPKKTVFLHHNGPTSIGGAPFSTSPDYDSEFLSGDDDNESNLNMLRKYTSPSDHLMRRPLRTSFESSGYGSPVPAIASTPLLADTPPTFRPTTSPITMKYSTSTPVDPWQLRTGVVFRTDK